MAVAEVARKSVVGKCRTIEVDAETFMNLPDNPIQRDTEKHAAFAQKRHLSKDSPTHRSVAVAEYRGRLLCKLDGHTRTLMWRDGRLTMPDTVDMTIYPISDPRDAETFYKQFDNRYATETTADRISGAMRAAGITPQSTLLRGNNYATALKMANSGGSSSGGDDEYELVSLWRDVIIEVDSWELPRNPFKGTGLVALMFLLVAAETHVIENVRTFFQKFANKEGVKNGSAKDGVQALCEHMEHRRIKGTMTGQENMRDIMSKGLSCVNAWCKGVTITNVQPSNEDLKELHRCALTRLGVIK